MRHGASATTRGTEFDPTGVIRRTREISFSGSWWAACFPRCLTVIQVLEGGRCEAQLSYRNDELNHGLPRIDCPCAPVKIQATLVECCDQWSDLHAPIKEMYTLPVEYPRCLPRLFPALGYAQRSGNSLDMGPLFVHSLHAYALVLPFVQIHVTKAKLMIMT